VVFLLLQPKYSVAKHFLDAIKTNDIVLDPEYQRDVVWDDMRAEGLIVSLLSSSSFQSL
jgi:hypothetical protein